MSRAITYDENKLKELVLYIGAKCWADEHYGVLKLNKILFYSDFRAFRVLGKPITGASYKKYTHGPAPRGMKMVRARMIEHNDAFEYRVPLPFVSDDGESGEKRLLAKRSPNLEAFLPTEMAIVDSVIERLRPLTGAQVSVMSHSHPGWAMAAMGELIPYATELVTDPAQHPLSKKDLERAKVTAERYRLGEIRPA